MNICFVVSTFPSRSQTFVTTQVLHALGEGHSVTVACKKGAPDPGLSSEARELLKKVRVLTWPPSPHALLQYLPKRLRNWIIQRQANDAWRHQIEADLVIAHFGYAGAAVARAQRGWAARPPLMTIYHGRDVSVEYRRNRLAKYKGLFADGDLHLTVNAPFADCLVAGGAPRDRVETHHLGVPVARYPFSPTAPGAPLRLVTVARLVPKKGLNFAIAALKRLRDTQPEIDWSFDIGGEGPIEQDLRDQVAEAGLDDRIRFLGALSHEDSLALIAGAHALVLPSVTAGDGDQEGIPVTLMEAMALGTVVCTTRHSGIPELVTHGVSGLLSEERDVDGLCANIAALATGAVDADAMVGEARGTIECKFDEGNQTAALFERGRRLADAANDG
ncbi:MAG: glycosyltransferase [Jannaschia sp.]